MRQPASTSALAALAIAVGLVGVSGCSDSSPDPGTSAASPADSAGSSADPEGTSEGTADPKAGAPRSPGVAASSLPSSGEVLLGADALPTPAADHCRTKSLTATAKSTGTGQATVVITNTADQDCSIRGYPSLLFTGNDGHTELPVDWAGSATSAKQYTLSPGDSAAARLTFISESGCEPFTGLDLVPPGEARPLDPAFAEPVRICDTGVRVTAFQPAG